MQADLKANKELMKLSVPNDMTGLVSEILDGEMTFQTSTFCPERISSKPSLSEGPDSRQMVWRKAGERRREKGISVGELNGGGGGVH